jgi:hypothetical protein
MPYKLSKPQPAAVATAIRITSFSYAAESNVMRVEFVSETSAGVVVEHGSELFGADELASVDEHGELRGGIKLALYAMLATSRGALGTVE